MYAEGHPSLIAKLSSPNRKERAMTDDKWADLERLAKAADYAYGGDWLKFFKGWDKAAADHARAASPATILDLIADARRTPAPEGEAVAWASEWRGLNGLARALHRAKDEAVSNAKWMEGRAFPLYASPVVPVGVSEDQRQRVAEIVEAAIERHAPTKGICHTLDDADAILAALGTKDQGSRSKASVPTEGGQAAVLEREVPRRYANDAAAKVIYDTWSDLPGWVPWVERGNSERQDMARREAAPASPIPGGYEPKANEPKETNHD